MDRKSYNKSYYKDHKDKYSAWSKNRRDRLKKEKDAKPVVATKRSNLSSKEIQAGINSRLKNIDYDALISEVFNG